MTAVQLSFDAALRKRDQALSRVARVVSREFLDDGARFVLSYLSAHGPTAGEVLTAEGERIGGLRPSDGRHWGLVFRRLSVRSEIVCVCYVPRLRGHGTAGGRVWALRG